MTLVTPRRSLRIEMPASAVSSQRKLRNLEQVGRNGATQDHHSVQIRIQVSFDADWRYVCIILMIHMTQRKLDRLEKAIQEIKQKIGKLGALRPGSLSKQARKTESTYGAYWHLSYTHRGKGHTQYIRDAFVSQVKAEVSNFKRFRKLIDRLITLSIERSQLRMKIDKKQ
jgi:hypothetical protein